MELELREELYKLLGSKLLISPSDRAALAIKYLEADCSDIASKSYRERVLIPKSQGLESYSLTPDYSTSTQDSIALYRVDGFISWESWWWVSTSQLIEDLKVADSNPNISAHFIIIDSPGGEVYGLNTLAATMRALCKPVVVACERMMCSAAYYYACSATKIYATNTFSEIGSIGVMCTLYNEDAYMERLGIKKQEIYATQSTRKNKRTSDALQGHPEELITDLLDPIELQFEADVKMSRPQTLENTDAGIYNGETYYAQQALELGLIDGILPIEEAITECKNLAKIYQEQNQLQGHILNNI